MKNLLCVLMFGMVFGGEVSQRTIDVTIESGSFTNLGELFPEDDLEWAIINVVGCPYDDYCILEDPNILGNSHSGLKHDSNKHFYRENTSSDFLAEGNKDFRIWFGGNSAGTIKLLVTAEFPEEDSGYIEEGFDYCIEEGANLIASPCRDAVPILDTLPSEIADNLTGIIGQGVAANNQNGQWQGSLSGLGGGNGYWFKSNVSACFNYNCAEN